MQEERTCRKCLISKAVGLFHKDGIKYRKHVCKACSLPVSRAWKQANKERRKVQHHIWSKKLKAEVFSHYGKQCECCGESEMGFLVIDHIGGWGGEHRRKLNLAGGEPFYRWLKKNNYPSKGLRTLCHNCNNGVKGGNICPHKICI